MKQSVHILRTKLTGCCVCRRRRRCWCNFVYDKFFFVLCTVCASCARQMYLLCFRLFFRSVLLTHFFCVFVCVSLSFLGNSVRSFRHFALNYTNFILLTALKRNGRKKRERKRRLQPPTACQSSQKLIQYKYRELCEGKRKNERKKKLRIVTCAHYFLFY